VGWAVVVGILVMVGWRCLFVLRLT